MGVAGQAVLARGGAPERVVGDVRVAQVDRGVRPERDGVPEEVRAGMLLARRAAGSSPSRYSPAAPKSCCGVTPNWSTVPIWSRFATCRSSARIQAAMRRSSSAVRRVMCRWSSADHQPSAGRSIQRRSATVAVRSSPAAISIGLLGHLVLDAAERA